MILTSLSSKDFKNILRNYNLGEYKSHTNFKHAFQNTVYIVITTKGKFILKIFEFSDKKFIEYQIKIMQYLSDKKQKVPKSFKNNKNKLISIFKDKLFVIQEFINGEGPKSFNYGLIKDAGKWIGKMDFELVKLKLKTKKFEIKFDDMPESRFVGNIDIYKEWRLVADNLKKVNLKKIRISVVHSDITSANLIVEKNNIKAIIDFGDVGESPLISDPCSFLVEGLLTQRGNKIKIRVFFKEYQKYICLNNEEKKALYYLTQRRFLQAIDFYHRQELKHKDESKKIERYLFRMIRNYFSFNKITLEEFIKLLNC